MLLINIRLISVMLLSFLLLSPIMAKAEPVRSMLPQPKEILTLGAIDVESDQQISHVNIRLDKKPSWQNLEPFEDHGSFLQLIVPGTLVPNPGQFFEGQGPYIKKIAVFQLTANDAAIRLFVSENAALIKQAAIAEILGPRILVSLEHDRLQKLLANASQPAHQTASTQPTAEEIIAKTEVRQGVPAPADLIKEGGASQAGKNQPLATGSFNLREKLIQVSLFSGVMLLLMLGSWMLKPYLKKRSVAKHDEPIPALKMVASLAISAKQKVSLLQVGDEKILIGVTPDAVTFLANLTQPKDFLGKVSLATGMQNNFAALLAEQESRDAAVELKPAPVPVKAPSPLPAKPAMSSPVPRKITEEAPVQIKKARLEEPSVPQPVRRPPGSRINISIGEDGVKDVSPPSVKAKKSQARTAESSENNQKAIDDVTKLIREKLKTLRTI